MEIQGYLFFNGQCEEALAFYAEALGLPLIADDRRSVRLRATEAGRRVLEEGRARRVHSLAERLRALDPDELACLERAAGLIEGIVRE